MGFKIFQYTLFIALSFVNVWGSETERTNMKETSNHKTALIQTTLGDIKIELYEDKAPVSVKNFIAYADEGAYDGTIFHRVIDGFMIQGGGFTKDFKQKPTKAPIKNEADNGLKNERGTLAMARTNVVDSATNQFFINVTDNSFLDFRSKDPSGYGYAVFGKVIDGMDVVDKIKKVKTGSYGPYQDVPKDSVEIINIKMLN
jgi:cyclophilin family peptidyl-prolyl cis-trans isomerase